MTFQNSNLIPFQKSMCNEIDYKTEMENLLTKQSPGEKSDKSSSPTASNCIAIGNTNKKLSPPVDTKHSANKHQSTTKNPNEHSSLNLNAKQVYMHESQSKRKHLSLKAMS
jgi:hypothetical protein